MTRLFISLLMLSVLFFQGVAHAKNYQESYDSILYIGKYEFQLEIANTPQTMQKGMMYRPHMEDNQAMLFVFAAPQQVTFWMKNTLIPLDMLFFDADGNLMEIKHDIPPCKQNRCPLYPSKHNNIQYVVELKGGAAERRNINTGERFYVCGFL